MRLGSGLAMALSLDGKWMLTLRLNTAPAQIVLLPTGAGEATLLTNDALSHGLSSFTADGAQIVFSAFEPDHRPRLYLQALSGGTPKPITPEGVTRPLSPDGSAYAFTYSVSQLDLFRVTGLK